MCSTTPLKASPLIRMRRPGPRLSRRCLTSEVKEKLRKEWAPEYEVEDFKPPADTLDTVSSRQTAVSLALCLEDKKYMYGCRPLS